MSVPTPREMTLARYSGDHVQFMEGHDRGVRAERDRVRAAVPEKAIQYAGQWMMHENRGRNEVRALWLESLGGEDE